jgi:hypothetical protein
LNWNLRVFYIILSSCNVSHTKRTIFHQNITESRIVQ